MSTVSANESDFFVREGSAESDSSAVLALWGEGFGELRGDLGARRLKWMYRDNPSGYGEFLLLEDGQGKLAGFKGLGMRRFRYRGETLTAGIMVDFVVSPEHRHLGPALRLLKGVVERGKTNLAFLYGFPNSTAEAVYKRAGCRRVKPTRRFARLIRSRSFLESRLTGSLAPLAALFLDGLLLVRDLVNFLVTFPRFRWDDDDEFDGRFDELWERGTVHHVITGERTRETLRWRFREVPGRGEVRVISAFSRFDDQIVGYVVWSPEGRTGIVLDFYSAGPPGVYTALLRRCAWQARKHGCHSLSLEFSGPASLEGAVGQAGFRPREENSVFFVSGKTDPVVTGTDWFLTSFDRD